MYSSTSTITIGMWAGLGRICLSWRGGHGGAEAERDRRAGPDLGELDREDQQQDRAEEEDLGLREPVDDRVHRSPASLQGTADAAVLADAPEVDRHEHHGDHRHGDAVEDVETQERLLADEAPAEQRVA